MRYQDMTIEATKVAADEVFRYAKKVPADKVQWKPLEQGRSVLELCQELAMCPVWTEDILLGKGMPEMNEEEAASAPGMGKLETVEGCEELCRQNLERLYATIAAFPDDKLKETYTLPFDGGQPITMEQNMDYPRWNFTYHLGQIAYIQTLYGDKSMYW